MDLAYGYHAMVRDWLKVELQSAGATCTLKLVGALSGTSIAALEAQLDQVSSSPWKDVIIDVRELKTIDATGANMLIGLNHYVDARGGRLTVTGARGEVAAALRECELIASVTLVEPAFEFWSATDTTTSDDRTPGCGG